MTIREKRACSGLMPELNETNESERASEEVIGDSGACQVRMRRACGVRLTPSEDPLALRLRARRAGNPEGGLRTSILEVVSFFGLTICYCIGIQCHYTGLSDTVLSRRPQQCYRWGSLEFSSCWYSFGKAGQYLSRAYDKKFGTAPNRAAYYSSSRVLYRIPFAILHCSCFYPDFRRSSVRLRSTP